MVSSQLWLHTYTCAHNHCYSKYIYIYMYIQTYIYICIHTIIYTYYKHICHPSTKKTQYLLQKTVHIQIHLNLQLKSRHAQSDHPIQSWDPILRQRRAKVALHQLKGRGQTTLVEEGFEEGQAKDAAHGFRILSGHGSRMKLRLDQWCQTSQTKRGKGRGDSNAILFYNV